MKRFLTILLFTLAASGLSGPVQAQDAGADSYSVGTGDLISIRVFGEEDLSLELRISSSGSISYPFLGELKISGLSAQQIERMIANGLRGDYLIDPKVNVTVLEYRQFYVNGEVMKPGAYQFLPGLTVRKAISIAGGMTERASSSKIFVIREGDAESRSDQVKMDDTLRPGDILSIKQSFF